MCLVIFLGLLWDAITLLENIIFTQVFIIIIIYYVIKIDLPTVRRSNAHKIINFRKKLNASYTGCPTAGFTQDHIPRVNRSVRLGKNRAVLLGLFSWSFCRSDFQFPNDFAMMFDDFSSSQENGVGSSPVCAKKKKIIFIDSSSLALFINFLNLILAKFTCVHF